MYVVVTVAILAQAEQTARCIPLRQVSREGTRSPSMMLSNPWKGLQRSPLEVKVLNKSQWSSMTLTCPPQFHRTVERTVSRVLGSVITCMVIGPASA